MAPQERPNGVADPLLMRPAAWGALFHKEPYVETNRKAVLIHKLQARSLASPLSHLPLLLQDWIVPGLETSCRRMHIPDISEQAWHPEMHS